MSRMTGAREPKTLFALKREFDNNSINKTDSAANCEKWNYKVHRMSIHSPSGSSSMQVKWKHNSGLADLDLAHGLLKLASYIWLIFKFQSKLRFNWHEYSQLKDGKEVKCLMDRCAGLSYCLVLTRIKRCVRWYSFKLPQPCGQWQSPFTWTRSLTQFYITPL